MVRHASSFFRVRYVAKSSLLNFAITITLTVKEVNICLTIDVLILLNI